MIYLFFALWTATAAAAFFARSRRTVHLLCTLHFTVHAAFAAMVLLSLIHI